MKTKQTLLLTIALVISIVGADCQQFQQLTKPKPVQVDGLGSLIDTSKRQLKYDELTRVVKTAIKRDKVDETDAQAMVQIYDNRINEFFNAAGIEIDSDTKFDSSDVESYLTLILRHDNLRAETERATFDECEKYIAERVGFADKTTSVAGNNAGVFISVLTKAYKPVFNDDNDDDKKLFDKKQSAFNDTKKVILLTAYESAAFAKTNGDNPATDDDKQKAAEFLKDLHDFNEQLDDKEKSLDANGRLINAQSATPSQRGNMKYAVTGGFDSSMKDQNKGRQLSEKLEHTMGYTALQMGIDQKQ